MCDSDGALSLIIHLGIDSFVTDKRRLPIPISTETFLNDCSSQLQSMDGLFSLFCLNEFASIQVTFILMTTCVKSDQFFYVKRFEKDRG
jgi:hypothetical protein